MNELQQVDNVIVKQGQIVFDDYEDLKKQALEVAEYVEKIEVNEESVKSAKKVLAAVNKSVKKLEDRRIAIKKEILEPYNEFEVKVKEIVGIVKEADTKVRDQVKELDEQERQKKRDEIEEIWNLRCEQYPFKFLTFEDFITPQHLNKSVKIDKVEEEMVAFLEKVNREVNTITKLNNSKEVLIEYKKVLDFAQALENAQEREMSEKEVAEIIEESEVKTYVIKIHSEKDFLFAKNLLEQNKIEFTVL